ncbi:MAG: YfcE family phosphodiesterase [Clostridia bacterium]|nr:YfcE family phosphodiesterase [Clostridia bacterium]
MKILVFSDSHGNARMMDRALRAHSADTDLVVHLGDGKREFLQMMQSYPETAHICVNGNYEDPFFRSNESTAVVELDGLRFFLTHGHGYGVKRGIYELMDAAAERGCDLALYGHTHVGDSRYTDLCKKTGRPMWIVNPGSITLPKDGFEPKYAIIRIIGGKPLISLASIE